MDRRHHEFLPRRPVIFVADKKGLVVIDLRLLRKTRGAAATGSPAIWGLPYLSPWRSWGLRRFSVPLLLTPHGADFLVLVDAYGTGRLRLIATKSPALIRGKVAGHHDTVVSSRRCPGPK
jgi:hypothetical protein